MFNKKISFGGRGIKYNFDAILQNNTVGWYDYTALSTLTLIDASVSRWNDKLGSGHDLIQAAGNQQPGWSSNGILFDGINDYMKTAPFIYNQPAMVYIVFKQITWTSYDSIFDGNTGQDSWLMQRQVSPNLRLYTNGGSYAAENSNLSLNTFGIVRVVFNAANSKIQVNNTTPTTGNAGSHEFGGFTLAAFGNADSYYGNIQVKEVILRNIVDTPGDEWKIYQYLKHKHNLNI